MRGRRLVEDVLESRRSPQGLMRGTRAEIVILRAALLHQAGPKIEMDTEIEEEYNKLEDIKEKKNRLQAEMIKMITYIIQKPNLLSNLNFSLQECIITALKVRPRLSHCSIGGEFSDAEKQYLLSSAKLELEYRREQDQLREEVMKKSELNKRAIGECSPVMVNNI